MVVVSSLLPRHGGSGDNVWSWCVVVLLFPPQLGSPFPVVTTIFVVGVLCCHVVKMV